MVVASQLLQARNTTTRAADENLVRLKRPVRYMWSRDVIDAVTKHLASRMDDPRLGIAVAAAGGSPAVVDLLARLKLRNPRVIAHLSCKDGGEFATGVINEAARLQIQLTTEEQGSLPEVWNLCMAANATARA